MGRPRQRAWGALLTVQASLGICGCDLFDLGGDKSLRDADCRPRTLQSGHHCRGRDQSFQECSFYFRAWGAAQREVCERIVAQAVDHADAVKTCALDALSAWERVACEEAGVEGPAQCFRCTENEHEAHKTYVFAYATDCTQGAELVTCNYGTSTAVKALGQLRLGG